MRDPSSPEGQEAYQRPPGEALSVEELARAGLWLSPLSGAGAPTRDRTQIEKWQLEGIELGIYVGGPSGFIAREIGACEIEDHERDASYCQHTMAIDRFGDGVRFGRVCIWRRPPKTFIPPSLRVLPDSQLVPLPPAEESCWVRGPEFLKLWPHHIREGGKRTSGEYRPGDRFLHARISPQDLLDDDPPLPESLLGEGLLPVGGLGLLAGPAGVGKTRCLFDLAASIASGIPWLGVQTTREANKRVAIIALETNRAQANQLFKALLDAHPGYDKEALTERVHLVCPDALGNEGPRLSIVDPDGLEDLVAFATEYDVLGLDPLYLLGGNLREEDGALQTVKALDEIRRRAGCAVIANAHERKGSAAGDRGSSLDRLYGSVYLGAALDLLIGLSWWKGREAGIRVLDFGKVRFAAEPDSVYVRLTKEGVPTVIEKPDGRSDAKRVRCDTILRELANRDGSLSRAEIGALILDDPRDEKATRTLQRDLSGLVKSGALLGIGAGPSTRYTLLSRHNRDTPETDRDITT
jgi:hypothetical protein